MFRQTSFLRFQLNKMNTPQISIGCSDLTIRISLLIPLKPSPVTSLALSGEGDGDEHHQPHQRSADRHDRRPATARGPEEEGDAAEGPVGWHPDAGPSQTHQHQPGSAAPLYPGEDLRPWTAHTPRADMEPTTKPALTGTLQWSSQPTDFDSECHRFLFFLNFILFLDS